MIFNEPATEIAKKIKSREIKAKEVIEEYLKRIDSYEPKIDSFIEVFYDSVDEAKKLDERIERGEPVGRLAGVPIAIKDNICISGRKISCGSKILENYISPYDATVIEKIKKEDGIIIGRTNMDEFAMGSSTENSGIKITKNPWNTERVPGGSSGGSAAAVAARFSPLALGSDTGGSIRQPAGFCGVIGLKPTYGAVSRYGLIAFASSLDQIGPLGIYMEDVELLLDVISGYDPMDSTSVKFNKTNNKEVKEMKIGVPKEYFIEGLESEVKTAVERVINEIAEDGISIEEISLPHTKYAVAAYYIIAPSEASSNLARYDGIKYGYHSDKENIISTYKSTREEGFGPEVKRRIMLGTYALSVGYYDAYYLKAQRVRNLIREDFEKAFEKVDLIITPTSPTPAFKIGEKIDDPLMMYLSDVFTIPCNLSGIGGISIPCGFTSDGLPIGLQLMCNYFDEGNLLRFAYYLQEKYKYYSNVPPEIS